MNIDSACILQQKAQTFVQNRFHVLAMSTIKPLHLGITIAEYSHTHLPPWSSKCFEVAISAKREQHIMTMVLTYEDILCLIQDNILEGVNIKT